MKQFLLILGITALVWLGVSMSEVREYPLPVRVEMTGYDTVRYAVLHADTTLLLQAEMSGFNAAVVDIFGLDRHVSVDMTDDGLYRAVALTDVNDQLRQQLSSKGVKRVSSGHDSLRLELAERQHRTFRVSLDSVRFSFSDQYGLYGEPSVSPSEVTLYGADEVLASLDEIHVVRTDVGNISSTGTYRLQLDPVWESLGDVRASTKTVEIYLPVEQYVEREYSVPVEVDGADSTVRFRLYPDQAKVRVWVAQCDLERMPEFRVVISYSDVLSGAGRLTPRLMQFPSWVRPRSVEPSEVQCVIIK